MLCQSCHRLTPGILCKDCFRRMRPGRDRLIGPGIRLIPAFEHTGPARKLVHGLKYRGMTGYADLVADRLVSRIPRLPLVPVPRVLSRRVRYGVDPAYEIAAKISSLGNQPLLTLLTAPPHAVRRAGGDHFRSVPEFAVRRQVESAVVLVDDVVTTGATLVSAAIAIGVERVATAVAANAVAQVSSLLGR